MSAKPCFYEFFAGGGMARIGLGPTWRCLFANDIDQKKGKSYVNNWGDSELLLADIVNVRTTDLVGNANLVWASFPCQDLSLAGAGAGLKGSRSGTFWPFWNIMSKLSKEQRAPDIIVLENVVGTLTSNSGRDFQAICDAYKAMNYSFGAVVINANLFLPQSRPRVFFIGVRAGLEIPEGLTIEKPSGIFHTKSLISAHAALSCGSKRNWKWWNISIPKVHRRNLREIIEEDPLDVAWNSNEATHKLLKMMSPANQKKVIDIAATNEFNVGTLYKRMRPNGNGGRIQRAEIRFDNTAGCLRTPQGGSSRQSILVIEGEKIRSRLLSGRETARLMGLPESYILPSRYTDCYHLTGDGVAVPVVRHLAEVLFDPIISMSLNMTVAA